VSIRGGKAFPLFAVQSLKNRAFLKKILTADHLDLADICPFPIRVIRVIRGKTLLFAILSPLRLRVFAPLR
jgi:hypothetical protein